MATQKPAETAPAEKSEDAAPSFEFESVDVPATSRPTKPNPFAEQVKSLVDGMVDDPENPGKKKATKALAFTVPNGGVEKALRQLSDAGLALGVTIRTRREAVAGEKTRVVFHPIPKITRARGPEAKPDASPAAAPTPEAQAAAQETAAKA